MPKDTRAYIVFVSLDLVDSFQILLAVSCKKFDLVPCPFNLGGKFSSLTKTNTETQEIEASNFI